MPRSRRNSRPRIAVAYLAVKYHRRAWIIGLELAWMIAALAVSDHQQSAANVADSKRGGTVTASGLKINPCRSRSDHYACTTSRRRSPHRGTTGPWNG